MLVFAPEVEAATRREVLIGAAFAAILAGCGRQSTDSARGAAAGYPRTVEHFGGTTELPTQPARVFSARTFYELDALLALGVVPAGVGTFPGRELRSWQKAAGAADAVELDITGGPNQETLAAEGIDLVIVNQTVFTALADEVEAYQAVAPVIVLPEDDVEQQLRIIGAVMGIPDDRVQARIDEHNATLASFAPATVPASISAFGDYGDGSLYVQTPASTLSQSLVRFGLPALSAPPVDADQVRKDYAVVSPENLQVLDSEVVLGLAYDGTDQYLETLETSPLFQQLPAVRSGNYFRLSAEESVAVGSTSVLSLPLALQTLDRVLTPR